MAKSAATVSLEIDGVTVVVALKTRREREMWDELKARIITMVGEPEYDDLPKVVTQVKA